MKHDNLFFIKKTQAKKRKEKTPDKKEQKAEHKK